MNPVRIGTCGFSYADWKEVFYPAGTKPGDYLRYYATRFDTVELNATFYRLPTIASLEGMVAKTPPGFTFIVKAHQSLTHAPAPEADLERAITTFRMALGPFSSAGKLGGVLLQFPNAFQPIPANRERLKRLSAGLVSAAPVIVEFRHRAWYRDDFLADVRRLGLCLCCVDEPQLPGLLPPVAMATGSIGYVRFHGRNKDAWYPKPGERKERDPGARYRYDYRPEELQEWVPKVRALAAATDRTYVFFNNHPDGHAAQNAASFGGLLAGAPVAG